MNNKQARTVGRIIIGCGCVLIILNQLWFALALIAVGLFIMAALGRCPHCGCQLITLLPWEKVCPKCRRPL